MLRVLTIRYANANRYWTKARQPDLNMATDDGSKVKLGFIVEANFLIHPELIKTVLKGINARSISRQQSQHSAGNEFHDITLTAKEFFRRSK